MIFPPIGARAIMSGSGLGRFIAISACIKRSPVHGSNITPVRAPEPSPHGTFVYFTIYNSTSQITSLSDHYGFQARSVHVRPGSHGPRFSRVHALRGGPVLARPVRAGAVLLGGGQVVRRGLRPEPVVLVRVRRARSVDGRLEEPAREQAGRRGARVVQPGGPGRHQADGRLHGRPAQRFQRGRHQGTAGQGLRGGRARPRRISGQDVRARRLPGGRGKCVRADISGRQGVRAVAVPRRVSGLPLRDGVRTRPT